MDFLDRQGSFFYNSNDDLRMGDPVYVLRCDLKKNNFLFADILKYFNTRTHNISNLVYFIDNKKDFDEYITLVINNGCDGEHVYNFITKNICIERNYIIDAIMRFSFFLKHDGVALYYHDDLIKFLNGQGHTFYDSNDELRTSDPVYILRCKLKKKKITFSTILKYFDAARHHTSNLVYFIDSNSDLDDYIKIITDPVHVYNFIKKNISIRIEYLLDIISQNNSFLQNIDVALYYYRNSIGRAKPPQYILNKIISNYPNENLMSLIDDGYIINANHVENRITQLINYYSDDNPFMKINEFVYYDKMCILINVLNVIDKKTLKYGYYARNENCNWNAKIMKYIWKLTGNKMSHEEINYVKTFG